MDADVTVLASKYLDELRKSGVDELNATHANIHVRNADGPPTNLSLNRVLERTWKIHQSRGDEVQ
jgi:hypothetical protein